MKWSAKSQSLAQQYFEIVYDPAVGYYLYVFNDNKCTHDYLQDTLELAFDSAMEDFGVPKAAWKQVE